MVNLDVWYESQSKSDAQVNFATAKDLLTDSLVEKFRYDYKNGSTLDEIHADIYSTYLDKELADEVVMYLESDESVDFSIGKLEQCLSVLKSWDQEVVSYKDTTYRDMEVVRVLCRKIPFNPEVVNLDAVSGMTCRFQEGEKYNIFYFIPNGKEVDLSDLNFSETWVQEADVAHGSVPAGTFTKKAKEIVDTLLKVSDSVTQAVRRINFYINRAGKDLPNKAEVIKAKDRLVNME